MDLAELPPLRLNGLAGAPLLRLLLANGTPEDTTDVEEWSDAYPDL